MAGKPDGSLHEADQFAITDNLCLISRICVVVEAVGVAQDVIELLGAEGIQNLVGCANTLPAEIYELTEHVAGCKMVRVCDPDEALEDISQRFSHRPIIGDAAIDVAAEKRMAFVMRGN